MSLLSDCRKATQYKTEAKQRQVMAAALKKHGYTKKPVVRQGYFGHGGTELRFYWYKGTKGGDLVLITGRGYRSEVVRMAALKKRAPHDFYIGSVSPRATVVKAMDKEYVLLMKKPLRRGKLTGGAKARKAQGRKTPGRGRFGISVVKPKPKPKPRKVVAKKAAPRKAPARKKKVDPREQLGFFDFATRPAAKAPPKKKAPVKRAAAKKKPPVKKAAPPKKKAYAKKKAAPKKTSGAKKASRSLNVLDRIASAHESINKRVSIADIEGTRANGRRRGRKAPRKNPPRKNHHLRAGQKVKGPLGAGVVRSSLPRDRYIVAYGKKGRRVEQGHRLAKR